MKKKNLQTTLIHTGDNAMAKNAAASVSVPKVLPKKQWRMRVSQWERCVSRLDWNIRRILSRSWTRRYCASNGRFLSGKKAEKSVKN